MAPAPAAMKATAARATARPVGGDPVDVQKAAPRMPRVPPPITAACKGDTLAPSAI